MLTTIYLQAGAERVYLRDVPGLIADALHPELPEGTPKVLSYLQKEATDRNLAWQWCGINNSFPVSLTEQDVRELNGGVWRNFPPLQWRTDTGEGPQRLATPLPEPEWEKYSDAFDAAPPEGWRLIPVWRNLVFEQWVMNDEARKEWKRLLEQHATTGRLKPRSEVSGIPTPHMVGRQLMDAFLSVAEFAEFAGQFDVEVRAPLLYVRTALAAPLLAQLKALPPGESVTVQCTMGRYFERGIAPAKDWLEELEADAQRQAAGYFTIREAAQWLSDTHGLDAATLLEDLVSAFRSGNLTVRKPETKVPLTGGRRMRDFYDWVTPDDINVLLADVWKVSYRSPNPTQPSTAAVAMPANVLGASPEREEEWKEAARVEARRIRAEHYKKWGAYPGLVALGDAVADVFRSTGITGPNGHGLAGSYIKRWALQGHGITKPLDKLRSTLKQQGK